jgi:hypothetical protein
MKRTITALTALTALAAALALAATAQAAPVKNGNFERGNLRGWQKNLLPNSECGYWGVYRGEWQPPGIPVRGDIGEPEIPRPPQGKWAAVAFQPSCPSAQILSQVVKLKKKQKHRLSFRLAYDNLDEDFFTPDTFALGPAANQQVRVDVMKAKAPIRSFRPNHILKRVFRTNRGDRRVRSYRRVTANLNRFAGKKVKLRFAVAVNQNPIVVGLDAVKIKSKKKR